MSIPVVKNEHVLRLAKAHLRVSPLKWNGTYMTWKHEFRFNGDPKKAKEAARKFLVDCYDATNIEFYRSPGASEDFFFAVFQMNDKVNAERL